MSGLSKLILLFLILNGIQNIILAYRLRWIASRFGQPPNYFMRMTSDQIFLYKKIYKELDKEVLSYKGILRYTFVTTALQVILVIILILTLS